MMKRQTHRKVGTQSYLSKESQDSKIEGIPNLTVTLVYFGYVTVLPHCIEYNQRRFVSFNLVR